MSRFLTDLTVTKVPGCELWRVSQPLVYHVGNLQSPLKIEVAPGFTTDFASVPRPLWPVFPPHGEYVNSAVVHDWLYQFQPCSRSMADAIFLEAMGVQKIARWKRWALYSGVRVGGWVPWDKKATKAEEMRRLWWRPEGP